MKRRTLINFARIVEVAAWGAIFCAVSLLENDCVELTPGLLLAFGALGIAGAARYARALIRKRTARNGTRGI